MYTSSLGKTLAVAAFGALLLATTPGTAGAAGADADNAAVTHRQNVMSTVGALAGTLGCVAKEECKLEDKMIQRHAKSLAFMLSQAPALFKNATPAATVKTTAKENIWTETAKFEEAMKKNADEVAKVVTLAAGSDKKALAEQIQATLKTCKGCHEDFRTK
ncbi:MAG: c-type cytochrome [Alphaproteobacteria bacterium]